MVVPRSGCLRVKREGMAKAKIRMRDSLLKSLFVWLKVYREKAKRENLNSSDGWMLTGPKSIHLLAP